MDLAPTRIEPASLRSRAASRRISPGVKSDALQALRSRKGVSVRQGRVARIASVTIVVAGCILTLADPARAALRAPGLEAPAANAKVQALPTFSWRSIKGAKQYEFQFAADRRFASIVLGTGKGKGSQRTRNTSATLTTTVPDGTYYWRVRGLSSKDKAGRWSAARAVTKAWTTTPDLQAPTDETSVTWPGLPLVLRWSPVPNATHYLVQIASDPTLAQSVISATNKPVETQGTVFTLQGTLPAGRYYWAITPVDGGGHRGTRSASARSPGRGRRNRHATHLDGGRSTRCWGGPVPGAARYEVDINPDDSFSAGARVCCKERVLGTSLSPLRVLPDNRYHWRVRPST